MHLTNTAVFELDAQGCGQFGSRWPLCLKDPNCVCVCSNFLCALLFVVLTAAVSSNCFQSTEADDCSNGDGWQTQRRKEWLSGQLLADKIRAEDITIDDGHEDGYCRFCSETNVWTRWRCRRVQHKHSLRFAREV